MIVTLLFALLSGTQAVPPRETVIDDAANGGLRDWRPVAGSPNDVYVRDRTERWYKVRLTGDCARGRSYAAMSYTTDAIGAFDRFSTVRFLSPGPIATCGVASIVQTGTPSMFDSKHARAAR